MQRAKNILLSRTHGFPVTLDVFYKETQSRKPVLIYAHGFNGFKDWGGMDRIAEDFAGTGFVFVKFNFSHNGTSPQQPEEFVLPETYGLNTYTKELDDLEAVIDWVTSSDNPFAQQMDVSRIGLIGHSLGGGIVLLKSAEDERVKAVTSWASISECKTPWGSWPTEKIALWKRTGVQYVSNSRTGQELPLYYTLHEDYVQNKERLNIERAVRSLHIPLLICHGTADTSVPVEKAEAIKNWKPDADLFLLDTDHVFGRKHPWTESEFPAATNAVVEKTIDFFSQQLPVQ